MLQKTQPLDNRTKTYLRNTAVGILLAICGIIGAVLALSACRQPAADVSMKDSVTQICPEIANGALFIAGIVMLLISLLGGALWALVQANFFRKKRRSNNQANAQYVSI